MVLPSSLGSSAKAVIVNEHQERQTAPMGRHQEIAILRAAVTSAGSLMGAACRD